MARIHHMMRNLRQSFGRDHQDFGPVFGQCAGGDRSCEDAREIERLDTRERPIAGSEGLRFAVCNFDDLDDRFRGECLSMWMGHPLGICPNHGARRLGPRRSRLQDLLHSSWRRRLQRIQGWDRNQGHLERVPASWAIRNAAGTSGHPWLARVG